MRDNTSGLTFGLRINVIDMKRILVIDDDDLMRTIIGTILKSAGYEVIDATNGNEGLLMFRANQADLVVTDLLMPEKDGLETIKELHAEFPLVPIVAMSGGSHLTYMDFLPIAKRLGARHIVHKPFQRDTLLKAVDDALNPQKKQSGRKLNRLSDGALPQKVKNMTNFGVKNQPLPSNTPE
jgi:DNA-binding NtrC family response regulator